VADRFHLLQNLAGSSFQAFGPHSQALKTVGATQSLVTSPESTAVVPVLPPQPMPRSNALPNSVGRGEKRTTNKSGNCTTKAGWLQQLLVKWGGRTTVFRYARTSTFPERQGRRDCGRSRLLDPYKDYVLQRWNDGCRRAFGGRSKRVVILVAITVARYARRFRQAQGTQQGRRRSIKQLPG